jgi:glyoxylase-like metal-dependent hydrolase (beta-lactamase superfamily II)
MNHPYPFVIQVMEDFRRYFNPYFSLFFPYRLMLYPFAALDKISPAVAVRLFSLIGTLTFPRPNNGSIKAKALKEDEAEIIDLNGIEIKGWRIGGMIVFPTPGHSPCSVSLYWPNQKALLISDADWGGNPAFMSGSLGDSLASLQKMKELVEAGLIDLLLPAHGEVKDGSENILKHLDFQIGRIDLLRSEVVSFSRTHGGERDVSKLTNILVRKSPLFKLLKHGNYPRHVIFVKSIVALALKEADLLS